MVKVCACLRATQVEGTWICPLAMTNPLLGFAVLPEAWNMYMMPMAS